MCIIRRWTCAVRLPNSLCATRRRQMAARAQPDAKEENMEPIPLSGGQLMLTNPDDHTLLARDPRPDRRGAGLYAGRPGPHAHDLPGGAGRPDRRLPAPAGRLCTAGGGALHGGLPRGIPAAGAAAGRLLLPVRRAELLRPARGRPGHDRSVRHGAHGRAVRGRGRPHGGRYRRAGRCGGPAAHRRIHDRADRRGIPRT